MNWISKRNAKKKEILEKAYDQNGRPDYNYYILSKQEKIFYSTLGCAAFFTIGFVFYNSLIISAVFSVLGLLAPDFLYDGIVKKRKINLSYQFKDLMYSLSSSLGAGKTVELSFGECIKDLSLIYPDPKTDIIVEVGYVLRGLSINETIESLLNDFARRAHDEDIQNFADVFVSSKRTGGNLIDVVKTTSNVITDKIEIKREIAVSLSEKKFEHKAMAGLMLGLILGLTYMSGDYMEPMFNSISGRIIMTVAFLLFVASYFAGDKIVNIEV